MAAIFFVSTGTKRTSGPWTHHWRTTDVPVNTEQRVTSSSLPSSGRRLLIGIGGSTLDIKISAGTLLLRLPSLCGGALPGIALLPCCMDYWLCWLSCFACRFMLRLRPLLLLRWLLSAGCCSACGSLTARTRLCVRVWVRVCEDRESEWMVIRKDWWCVDEWVCARGGR